MFARILIFIVGLFTISLGIATVTRAGLGTGTVSVLAYVLTECTGMSMGFFVFLTNFLFFVLQTIVDPSKFLIKAAKQIPACAVFGGIFDVSMWLTGFYIDPQSYCSQVGWVLVGAVLNGFGISAMVFARLLVLPPEGFVLSVMHRWGGSFGTLRTGVDIALLATAVVLSFTMLGSIVGIREGTVMIAFMAGKIANVFLKIWGKLLPKVRPID